MERPGPQRVVPRTVAECVDSALHAGPLGGAWRLGEAAVDGRIVRVGVWRAANSIASRTISLDFQPG